MSSNDGYQESDRPGSGPDFGLEPDLGSEPERRGVQPPIFAKSSPGHRGLDLPPAEVETEPVEDLLRGVALRATPPRLPELSEPEVVRHYTLLSHLNHAVDLGIYPLGSCTMKYNPKLSDEMAGLSGFTELHPYQPETQVQGILRLLWELEQALLAITGMARMSLQPAAGAQGELVGILMMRAYHRSRGEAHRKTILVPDTAHGTNLASAAMAGYTVIELPSSERGLIDVDTLGAHLSESTAGLMLTNPNTLGLFEEDILEISRLVHEAGGLVYYDGANLNAIMGRARPGDMGMDVVHLNPHKTFAAPHGGGGPGAGPVAVTERLEPFLPLPLVACRTANREPEFYFDWDRPQSIGRVKGFYGNISVLVRAYTYVLRMGGEGLRRASEDAVLNANYLRVRLRDVYHIPYDRTCMHEFVASAARQKTNGVEARDIAKRILDFGMHAPTVYFPLTVPEALMIEPTETESLRSLDEFVSAMRSIAEECDKRPEVVREAPHNTPVRRPDEVEAARHPVLRWT